MALSIITRQSIHRGRAALIIYRKGSAYQVALVHPSQRLEALPEALFWTYAAAHTRLQQEVRERPTATQDAVTDVCDRCDQVTRIAYAGLLPAACTSGWGKLCGPCWAQVQAPAPRANPAIARSS